MEKYPQGRINNNRTKIPPAKEILTLVTAFFICNLTSWVHPVLRYGRTWCIWKRLEQPCWKDSGVLGLWASKAVTSESLGFLKQRLAPGNCRICLSFPTSNSVFFNGD